MADVTLTRLYTWSFTCSSHSTPLSAKCQLLQETESFTLLAASLFVLLLGIVPGRVFTLSQIDTDIFAILTHISAIQSLAHFRVFVLCSSTGPELDSNAHAALESEPRHHLY